MAAGRSKSAPGTSSGAWRPDGSGAPRRMRMARTPSTAEASPVTALGAASHSNTTPSSSAWETSRMEPGMLARSRRYRQVTDLAPWRTAVRTQSMAVSPPPTTTTSLPPAFSSPDSKASTLSPRPVRLEAIR